MSLLSFERVSKTHGSGAGVQVALREVSFELQAGELVALWGQRRSGRSTLLRVAAGIERPDTGVVRFAGEDISRDPERARQAIGYCRTSFRAVEGRIVLDQLVHGQLTRGVGAAVARVRAHEALHRTGIEGSAAFRVRELDPAERVRVGLARAWVHKPRLLVADEPTLGIEHRARDEILSLLRSLADEGITVLASTVDATGLRDVDRTLAISRGELRSNVAAEHASVVALRPASGQ